MNVLHTPVKMPGCLIFTIFSSLMLFFFFQKHSMLTNTAFFTSFIDSNHCFNFLFFSSPLQMLTVVFQLLNFRVKWQF